MRKYAILVVLMVFVAAVTTGCGLIVKDPEVDAQTVIIEVVGEEFVKADVQQTIENVLDYQEYIYSIYGISYDRTDEDSMAAAQDTAISAMIEEAVTAQKLREYELDQFTDEELAAFTETVDEAYTSYIDTVKALYFTDTELTGEELDAAIDAEILAIGYGSRESLLDQEKQTEALARLKNMVVIDVTVIEDEIEAQYNAGVADAITTYATSLTQFATDLNNDAIIYFHPEGYRYVKNLLIKIGDEKQTEISSLTSQLADDQDSLDVIQEAIAALPADPTEDIEDKQKTRLELTAQVETLNAEIETITAQLTEMTADAYGTIEPTVNVVLSKIESGEDFDALIEEFGADTGMMNEPAKSMGYLICDGLGTYLEEFVDKAMALKSIGDISEPFRTSYGIHIVQYASDLDTGKVALSKIHDRIAEELLTTKQDTMYDETISQWVMEASAIIHLDRLAD